MNIKYLTLLLCPLMLLLAASCSDDDDNSGDAWQKANAAYWDSIYADTQAKVEAGNASWKIYKKYSLESSLSTLGKTDYIVVHVLNKGTGSGCPLYTDSVRVRYTGRLIPTAQYPDGYVFDTNNPYNLPDSQAAVSDFAVSALVPGFATALQYMHIGDKWEVYIPWTLGYGETASGSIPAYSVLRFTIQLVAYSHAGSSLPTFNAKKRK